MIDLRTHFDFNVDGFNLCYKKNEDMFFSFYNVKNKCTATDKDGVTIDLLRLGGFYLDYGRLRYDGIKNKDNVNLEVFHDTLHFYRFEYDVERYATYVFGLGKNNNVVLNSVEFQCEVQKGMVLDEMDMTLSGGNFIKHCLKGKIQ